MITAANGGWKYPAFLSMAASADGPAGEGAFAVKPAGLPVPSGPATAPHAA